MSTKEEIDNLRRAMGTLPSQIAEKKTKYIRGCSKLKVKLIDYPTNYAKAICAAATATWGDNEYEDKWTRLTPQNRFKVVLSAVSGNTLPQALEGISFTFKVTGCPRHSFAQWVRARYSSFFSSGCRDNSRADCDIILYTKLYDKCFNKDGTKTEFGKRAIAHFEEMKDLYTELLKNKSSYQIARSFMPMSYSHPFHFAINYLALQGQESNRMKFCEEEHTVGIAYLIREEIKKISPLLADFLRPGCDRNRTCQYSKSNSLSNAFGCLFSSCGRNPGGTDYSTFNESCSDVNEIEKQLNIKIPRPNDWINYTEEDYNKLDIKDKELFEED